MNCPSQLLTTVLVLAVVLAVACGGDDAPPGERVLTMIQDERSYVETLEAPTEDEQLAIGAYLNHLNVFELGAKMSNNLEWDLCRAGIRLERQAIAGFRDDPRLADSPLWDRYGVLLDDLEALLCREYDELTLVGDRYIGPIGDFRVNEGDLFAAQPCSASLGEFPPFPSDFHESELWVDAFSANAQPDFCSDDDRLLAIFEYQDDAILKRGYFYELPLVVNFNRLREPPELLEVEGHAAIVGVDAPSSEQVYLYAIERTPEAGQPGIFVFVLATNLDVDFAAQVASSLMR